ncbi:hypothetical protein GCM10025859_34510 [Alicyclobacillus fastidiosus]|nr:hypothetical protein GCM10025859_34510 [Alicyclobacillus fastidiosus]
MGNDGRYVHPLEMLNGKCNVVLFEYAEGKKPTPPFSLELYREFGVAIARMHTMSSDFESDFQRSPLNLKYLVDTPVSLVLSLFDENEDRLFLCELAKQITVKMNELDRYGLDWGPIHGDATLDNLHVTDDGQIILYDFDSGGPGWRASDLQGWAKNDNEYADKWRMFQDGYRSIRQLKEVELQAAPYLHLSWEIWGIKVDLEQRILKQGTEKTASYIQKQLRSLRENREILLS